MTPSIILPRLMPRERLIARIGQVLASLDEAQAWRIEIHEHKPTRSSAQNRYLWGVVYETILKMGGEAFAGWTKDDLHESFLGDFFGWEERSFFGRRKFVPIRRSSKLNKQEFADYIAHIQQRMASVGVFIPDPDPNYGLEVAA